MDKLQALLKGIETEFQIKAEPTDKDISAAANSNIKKLEDAKAQVETQLDQAFDEIVNYIRYTRASLESLLRLRNHIDTEIKELQALQEKQNGVRL